MIVLFKKGNRAYGFRSLPSGVSLAAYANLQVLIVLIIRTLEGRSNICV